jgi:hypothetical protein
VINKQFVCKWCNYLGLIRYSLNRQGFYFVLRRVQGLRVCTAIVVVRFGDYNLVM